MASWFKPPSCQFVINPTTKARSFTCSWNPLLFRSRQQSWTQTYLWWFSFNGAAAVGLTILLYFLFTKVIQKIRARAKATRSRTPKATLAALESIRGTAPGIGTRVNRCLNQKAITQREDDEKFQAGEPYGDPKVISTGLADDLRAIGLKAGSKDLQTLIEVFKNKGKPINDRQMEMEKMIAITSSLPRNSTTRKKLSGVIIDTLWSSLQHPPLSYLGNQFQYRTPDGSFNNPLMPDLGKAGSPYARTVPKIKSMHGVPPDPGLLFDLLMARTDESFKENPAGISSILFYHASIIIHDVFRTNRFDSNISDTSSYLDLAPLYGSSLEDQLKIRTMERGLLKPDTFHERRLLGQPPGINVMLIMYNRFHNYVADVLLKINEGGRFSLPSTNTEEDRKAALAKQDDDLFQTARLIVGGLYINICLHDYLRGLTNTHHSSSDWTLDPRIAVNNFDSDGVPKGVGNQVSAEFNLLYRFHSTISKRDERWLNDFLRGVFPDTDKPLDQLTPQEFVQGLFRFERSIPDEPSQREFGGLKRGPDGKFNDADLVRIMKESMEDPAGLFGPRMVPKALRVVEITGILTARKWRLASLNEMRDFFKLQRHGSFEDLNPDTEIADLLRKLYDHPDMVEMYPGMFLEDAKPRMDPGCGGCPPYTVGRAVFSDAITLVRSDRFYTVDYTASNLTNWGIAEVQQDYDVLGGSMFYKLFQRAFPGWFPYNSLHIMQPMFTRKMNEQIAREIGTIEQYSLADPAPPRRPVFVEDHSTISQLLKDQVNFRVPWAVALNDLFPGKKDYSSYMLGGDKPANAAQRKLFGDILFAPVEFGQLLSETAMSYGKRLLETQTLSLTKGLKQVDIIRDIAIPLNTKLLADLFSLDLKTDNNPLGTLSTAQLYKHLIDVRTFGFNNNDPAMAWQRRMWARKGAEVLTESTIKVIKESATDGGGLLAKLPIIGPLFACKGRKLLPGSLRWYGNHVVKELMAAGNTVEEAADICWLTAVAGVGAPISVFADVLSFFLRPENARHWEDIQDLVSGSNAEVTSRGLRRYVLEAMRLTSSLRGARVCVGPTTINGQFFNAGDFIMCLFGKSCMSPEAIPKPHEFRLDRPSSAYIHWGTGPHECLGKEISLTLVVSLVRIAAELRYLRPAPGDMGSLKSIHIGTERFYLNDSWSRLAFDPSTWKIHFEGHGKGVYIPPAIPVTSGRDLNAISNALVKQSHELVHVTKEQVNGTRVNGFKANGHGEVVEVARVSANGHATVNGAMHWDSSVTEDANWFFDEESFETVVKPLPPGLEDDIAEPLYETHDVLRTGSFSKTAHEQFGPGLGSYTEHIQFAKPYSRPPKIFLGVSAIDFHCETQSPSFYQEARNVSREGFDLVVQVHSSKLWHLQSVWLEIPDNGKYKNVLVGSFDLSKSTSVSSMPGTYLESPLLLFKDLSGGGGDDASKGRPRSIIPWIAGFSIDTTTQRAPLGMAVGAIPRSSPTGDDGVVLLCRKPTLEVNAVPRSARINFLTFFEDDKELGLSHASAFANFPYQATRSIMVSAEHNIPAASSVAGIDRFLYTHDTSSIRLRLVDKQDRPNEARYALESWSKPLAHDLSASIVMIPKAE